MHTFRFYTQLWHDIITCFHPICQKKPTEEHFSEGINDPAGGFNKNARCKVSRAFKTSVYQLCLQIYFPLKDNFNKKNCKCIAGVCVFALEREEQRGKQGCKISPSTPSCVCCDCNMAVEQIWPFELGCPVKRLPEAGKQTQDLHAHSQTMINAFDMPSFVLLALKFRTRSVCIHARNTK